MAAKGQRWLVDSGILRKKSGDEEPQELLVFGYSCKLFRDDEKAKMIDQGKHLIPWMGDNTLKIDRCLVDRDWTMLAVKALHSKMLASEVVLTAERPSSKVRHSVERQVASRRSYDGRGALADLRSHEPPSGGYDLRTILTEDEIRVEQLCDEERFRSLYNNDIEEATYHEEEIKRLHQALGSENTYGQVSYNYDDQDSQKALSEDTQSPKPSEGSQEEEDQAFVVPPELEIPEDMTVPETQKLNAIITKTALFISRQGSQMEILIKAKQANNPQFSFLSIDGTLHPYYRLVLEAIKSGKYNPEKQPEKEESESAEESDEDDESYLHPSLASSLTKVEAAPSIPSIQYKPSADCAYSMLVNKITGKPPPHRGAPPLPPEVPAQAVQQPAYYPPYTPVQNYAPVYNPPAPQQYSHGPVLYGSSGQTKSPPRGSATTETKNEDSSIVKENPIALVPYGPTPPKPLSRPSFIVPPADVQIIIDKMASYVAKNGRDFEAIVRNKGDPRFNFLELSHQYHGYYAHKLTIYEGAINPKVLTEEELLRKQEPQEEKQKKLEELQKKQQRMEEVQKRVKMIQAKKRSDSKDECSNKQTTTVSFSIKKPKDGEGTVIEKRSALPMEESDDELDEDKRDNDSKASSPRDNSEDNNRAAKIEKESSRVDRTRNNDNENELVDLTDDILEDCQKEIRHRQAEEPGSEKSLPGTREKHVGPSRDRQLQLERKKKAAMFLSQIVQQTSVMPKIESKIDNEDSDEIRSIPSPSRDYTESSTLRVTSTTSLMNRLKSADLSGKRSRPRSRSRSGSRDNYSDRHRSHKKHKKKKSSHRSSHDSSSISRSHKSKKSKKSSSRHRTRSRSPSKRHQPGAKRPRAESDSSSSVSSEP